MLLGIENSIIFYSKHRALGVLAIFKWLTSGFVVQTFLYLIRLADAKCRSSLIYGNVS